MSSLRFTPVAETSHQALLIWPRFAWIRQLFCDWVWHMAWIKSWTENWESHLLLFKHTVRAVLMEFDLPGGYCVCMSPYVHWLDNNLHCICVQSDTLSGFSSGAAVSSHENLATYFWLSGTHVWPTFIQICFTLSCLFSCLHVYVKTLCIFFIFI